MEKIIFIEIVEKDIWETFISVHPEANFLHSWYWGEFHSALGKKIHRIGAYRTDSQGTQSLVGVMLMIIEEAKRGRHILVPAGPICDWGDGELLQAMVREMQRIAKLEKAVFVRVRPELPDTKEIQKLFKELGFITAPTHLHAELTSVVDLTPSLDDILKNMRKQTRAEIRKAEKENVQVSTTTDPKAIRGFYDREVLTARRQGFVPFSYEFLFQQFKIFTQAGLAKLYTATHDGEVLAEAFVIFYGNQSAYHYGVSTDLGRKYPGAYAVQWQIMQDAKALGMTKHNLWGVAPVGKTKHRFYPISIFKRGFGGQDFAYVHARDLVISPVRYISCYCVEYIRNLRRGL